jgi:hypothetical protein
MTGFAVEDTYRIRRAKEKAPREGIAGGFFSFNHNDQARSKRSAFITLVHAATKSLTNFSFASALA